MKFIHTSDWHIGNYFSDFSKIENEELSNGRIRTIESIFIYADKFNIPMIIVSGDQFDSDNIDESLVLKIFNIIKNYKDIKVIMITGNHDPFTPNSIYNKINSSHYPDNLLFTKDRDIIFLKEYNCKIYTSSLKSKNSKENPIDWIDDENLDDVIKIAVCHGSIMIDGKYSEHDFPIPIDIDKKKKLDYVAMGHFHSYLKINDRIYYPGTPEQLQFKDNGSALVVDIEKNNT
ncbi:MAG TPA: DNA repair exonuclease, partial [Spirochaetota bacterium]|nr:DNA repair exonuclease [Spirochaetota bacterium]